MPRGAPSSMIRGWGWDYGDDPGMLRRRRSASRSPGVSIWRTRCCRFVYRGRALSGNRDLPGGGCVVRCMAVMQNWRDVGVQRRPQAVGESGEGRGDGGAGSGLRGCLVPTHRQRAVPDRVVREYGRVMRAWARRMVSTCLEGDILSVPASVAESTMMVERSSQGHCQVSAPRGEGG